MPEKMGNVIFDVSKLPGCFSAREFGALWAAERNVRCLASNIVKKWKQQQQSLGASQMRWKMTGWFADLGLGLLKLELDGTWDSNPFMQLAPNY